MNLTMTGGTARQRDWFQQALDACTYPFDNLSVSVEVTWVAEPSCPGHTEYACTHGNGGGYLIEIRDTLDHDVSKQFYMETCVHELGHVICFTMGMGSDQCSYFQRKNGGRHGKAADLDPLDKTWDNRIQEAMAETVKDSFLPKSYRAFDNRTYWQLDRNFYTNFMSTLGLTGQAGLPGYDNTHIMDGAELTRSGPVASTPNTWWQAQWRKQIDYSPFPYPIGIEVLSGGLINPRADVPGDPGPVFWWWFWLMIGDSAPPLFPDLYFGDLATYYASKGYEPALGDADWSQSFQTVQWNGSLPRRPSGNLWLVHVNGAEPSFSETGRSFGVTADGANPPTGEARKVGVPTTPDPPSWPYADIQTVGSPPPGKRVPGRRISGATAATEAAVQIASQRLTWRMNKN